MCFVSRDCCHVAGSLMVLLIFGCGGSGDIKPIANLVSCSGTVTLDGAPLKQGIVSFAPVNPTAGQPATGAIKDGKFTMATTVSAPGVVAGQYKVSVQSFDQEKAPSTNPSDMVKKPTSLIPEKYLDITKSGLEAEVKKGMTPIKLELVSK
jgi:hypothetical protein